MRKHLTYANVMATIAVFIALGGTAYAVNTVGSSDVIDESLLSQDIKNGEVKVADIGQGAVASDEVKNDAITNADVAPNTLSSARILDATLTGADVANNTLKGADIDEATLDVGDAARAYARISPDACDDTSGECTLEQSKGISSVNHFGVGDYCVTAPGIDAIQTPAAVTVDTNNTSDPNGNASAMTREAVGCGFSGFLVVTERQPNISVDQGGGINNAVAVGPAQEADDVAFTIVIP